MGVGSGYQLRAVDEFGNTATSSSFTIAAFSVTNPRNGDLWARGQFDPVIRWTDTASPEVRLALYRGYREVLDLSDGWILNQGTFTQNIEIPDSLGGGSDYFVRVSIRKPNGEIWEVDSDRFTVAYSDNERQGAANLSTSRNSTGGIDYSGDTDFWSIHCQPLHTYNVRLESDTDVRLELFQGSDLICSNIGKNLRWDSDIGGAYFLKVTGLAGQEGTYTISVDEEPFPEAHRIISVSLGGTALLSNGFEATGFGAEASVFYSPIRYTDIGLSYNMLQASEAMHAIIDPSDEELFGIMGLSAGIQTPELANLSLRAGANYSFVVSEPQYYWIDPRYEDVTDEFVSSVKPYFGLDWKVFSRRYGSALFLRLQRSFSSFKAGKMSFGLVFSSAN